MSTTYDEDNLLKHVVTVEEADEVLANDPVDDDLTPSDRGNDRVMFVGFTFEGRLLEIGIEYLPDDQEHVFHGMDATKNYRKLFSKRKE